VTDERVRQLSAEHVDSDLPEEWIRETAEPEVRNVGALKMIEADAWQVTVWAAEFVREEPLESLLRKRMHQALRSVEGVTRVAEEDREVWLVSGSASGADLTRAAAAVVDELADQIRHHIEQM
jgi:hypothetical protein